MQDAVFGLVFMALGAIASWLASRAYYLRSTRRHLSIVSRWPWRLLANVEEHTRARLQILVDGEPANDLTRLRYEFTNHGYVTILPQAPIRLPLTTGAVVVEASVPAAGPTGLHLDLSVDAGSDISVILVNAPILNSGDRFVLEVLVRDLDESFEAVFNLQAPGLAHQITPTFSAPFVSSTPRERLYAWFMGLVAPFALLAWMGIISVRYLGDFFSWRDLPALLQLPPNAVKGPAGYAITATFVVFSIFALWIGLRSTRKQRQVTPPLAPLTERDDLTVSSLPVRPSTIAN